MNPEVVSAIVIDLNQMRLEVSITFDDCAATSALATSPARSSDVGSWRIGVHRLPMGLWCRMWSRTRTDAGDILR
jgi:hypothetical protein